MNTITTGSNDLKQLKLAIEGKGFKWPEQYITGAEIKKLGGIDAESDLYLSISKPWKDELIENDRRINLALPEVEQFFVKNDLRYTINGVEFKSNKQFINGKQLRAQGTIPDGDVLYLLAEKNWEDNLIEDDEWVDLARPGKEDFVSRSPTYCIVINTRDFDWNKRTITYEEVVRLAHPDFNPDSCIYTVKYTNGPKQNPQGSMSAGDFIYIKNKIKFHVTPTNKS